MSTTKGIGIVGIPERVADWTEATVRLTLPGLFAHLNTPSPSPLRPVAGRTRIHLLDSNVLVAVNGGGIGAAAGATPPALATDATTPTDDGIFTMTDIDGETFALQTPDGTHYITAVNGGGIGQGAGAAQPLLTDGRASDPDAVFGLVFIDTFSLRIVTADGQHYVTATNGGGVGGDATAPIVTTATCVGPNERLRFDQLQLSRPRNGPSN